MLSSAKIGRSSWRYYQQSVAGGACEYFAGHGERPGRWHGNTLELLGLMPGAVVAEAELEALFGRALSPTSGRVLGASWRADAVTGFDLTFSAPKSVSALWALGDDRTVAGVHAAHAAAVDAALGYLQAHAAFSRRGKDGVEQIGSAGYAAALFDHRTSRTGDPQLHTHALVVNKVWCADGAWRTLDGHEVYHHKKAAGAIYQAALRAELTARLPVVFGAVSEHGQGEIAGVPEDLLTAWSTRTSAVMADAVPTIAQAEEALGRPLSAAERARVVKTAVLATRPAKEADIAEGDLRNRWSTQAAALGWDNTRLTEAVTGAARGGHSRPAQGWEGEVMTAAVTAVGRSKAIWSRADLTVQIAARIPPEAATTATGGDLGRDALSVVRLVEELAGAALAVAGHGAVPLGADQAGVTVRASDGRFASAELVATEARILERAITGGFNTPSRLPVAVLTQLLDGGDVRLSLEQRQAAVRLVASADLVTVMTAPAGAGKTTTLAAAVEVWRGRRDVIALAPSARAAAELSTATGAPGMTVARWLIHQTGDHPARPGGLGAVLRGGSVVIVDEASMLTTSDLDQLTAHVQAARSQLVLVGDPGQIGAVNAPGGMFEHLTARMGQWTIQLTELHRFQHAWEGAATLRLRDGDPSVLAEYAARDRIHPEISSEDAADAVFDRWTQAQGEGLDALMLARSWADVTALNTRARAAAIATGQVTGPALATLSSRSPSTGGHAEVRQWRAGDVLIAKKNTTRIRLGEDTLRNGDRFTVAGVSGDGGLVVDDLTGRGQTTLPVTYLARYTEYGWATTIDGAQGATTDIGIVLARSGLDREHLYVAMSRGRLANHVHTTPELNTGDAGPHRPTHARLQPPDRATAPALAAVQAPTATGTSGSSTRGVAEQLALPDLGAAITQLTAALATSGRERAAHTLLDPRVDQAAADRWAKRDAGRREATLRARPEVIPVEHHRRQHDLERARQGLDHATTSAQQHHDGVQELSRALDQLPSWSRGKRRDLSTKLGIATTHQHLADQHLSRSATKVNDLIGAVTTDTAQRDAATFSELQRAASGWTTRPSRTYRNPNPDTAAAIPTPPVRRPSSSERDPRYRLPSTPGRGLTW